LLLVVLLDVSLLDAGDHFLDCFRARFDELVNDVLHLTQLSAHGLFHVVAEDQEQLVLLAKQLLGYLSVVI